MRDRELFVIKERSHHPANPPVSNAGERCPTRLAASPALVRLIEKGADVNLIDNYGRSPLSEACEDGNLDAAQL